MRKTTFSFIILTAVLITFLGNLRIQASADVSFLNESKEERIYCRSPSGDKMSLEEARDIARTSEECRNLAEEYNCNNNSGTWWLDLDIKKEMCNPACVINVTSGEARINWRCTGFVP